MGWRYSLFQNYGNAFFNKGKLLFIDKILLTTYLIWGYILRSYIFACGDDAMFFEQPTRCQMTLSQLITMRSSESYKYFDQVSHNV